jgi:hypothetical protein
MAQDDPGDPGSGSIRNAGLRHLDLFVYQRVAEGRASNLNGSRFEREPVRLAAQSWRQKRGNFCIALPFPLAHPHDAALTPATSRAE